MKQNKEHLPVYGVGPIYGVVVILLTIAVCVAANVGIIDSFKIPDTRLAFTIIGILAIIIGVVVWFSAAISIDKYIKNNKLCTEGIYEWVRNPCYSGIMFICTGAIFLTNNMLLLLLPVVYWLFLTILVKCTEEKWLTELYKDDYKKYCKEVNRCIPFPGSIKHTYKTKISDMLWIIYDIPGNIGWILYGVVLVLIFKEKPEYIKTTEGFTLMIFAIIPAVIMLIGVFELINERINKLDRVLSQKRLFRGFGSLLFGGITGAIMSVIIIIVSINTGFEASKLKYMWELLIGSVLLIVFGGLLFIKYKKQN